MMGFVTFYSTFGFVVRKTKHTRVWTAVSCIHTNLYGGADTQPGSARSELGIGERNIEAGWRLIDQYGFQLEAVDVGENIPRNVAMDLATGEVSMRRGAPIPRRT